MASPIDTAASSEAAIAETIDGDYKYGFFTDIDAETAPKGLDEDTVRFISANRQASHTSMLSNRIVSFVLLAVC